MAMSIEKALIDFLLEDTSIDTACSSRCWADQAEYTTSKPYIVVTNYLEEYETTLDGDETGIINTSVYIDIIDDSAVTGKALYNLVRTRLKNQSGVYWRTIRVQSLLQNNQEPAYDEDYKEYRFTLSISIFHEGE